MADVGSDSDDQVDFQQSGSGASKTYPQQCSALRKNGFVVIKERPCKIVEMSTSKTGKHGHAKVNLVGIDIFTGRKYEDICPSTHNMDVPVVARKEYGLLDITDDGFCSLLDDDNGSTRDDLKLPTNDIGQEIRDRLEKEEQLKVTVLKAMDEEAIISYKIDNESKK